MTREIKLMVNDAPIALDYFVQGFIDHTVGGMLEALEGTGEIKTLELSIDGDEVKIDLNNASVPLNFFASKIIKSTVTGLVSSLKGVAGKVNEVRIDLRR